MVDIQKPSLTDLPQLAELASMALWESHGHSAAFEDMNLYIRTKLSEEALRAELLDERNIFRWIRHEGRPAGYSKIIFDSPHDLVPALNVTKMERLYFLQEFHGLGLAQQLFAHSLDMAKQANQAGVWLNVWKPNHRAVAFYQKMGFEIVGESLFKISETHYNPNHVMYLEIGDW